MTIRQLVEDGLYDAMRAGALPEGVDRDDVARYVLAGLLGPQLPAQSGELFDHVLTVLPPLPASPDQVLYDAARLFRVTAYDIRSDGRTRDLVLARHVAMYVARTISDPPTSYPALGRAFCRDHSSVMAGVARISRGLSDRRVRLLVQQLEAMVRGDAEVAA